MAWVQSSSDAARFGLNSCMRSGWAAESCMGTDRTYKESPAWRPCSVYMSRLSEGGTNLCAVPCISTAAEVGAVCTNKQDGFVTWLPSRVVLSLRLRPAAGLRGAGGLQTEPSVWTRTCTQPRLCV